MALPSTRFDEAGRGDRDRRQRERRLMEAGVRQRCARRGGMVGVAALALLSVVCGPAGAGSFAQVSLNELPRTGSLSSEAVTLEQLAAKYRSSPNYGADRLLVYLWDASATWAQPVPRAYTAELAMLDETLWDRRLSTKITPVSIVRVHGARPADVEQVCQAIQRAAREKQRIPTFVAADDRILDALGGREAFIPAVFLVSTDTLAVTASRSDDPVAAYIWVQSVAGERDQSRARFEPKDIPAGCERSWFRRHLARVVRAGIVAPGAGGLNPKAQVTDVEFAAWLGKISPTRAASALTQYDPKAPSPLSRERAITATVKFLYGESPESALGACPLPTIEIGVGEGRPSDAPLLWQRAFNAIPGAAVVTPSLRRYLVPALAKGLLYEEPSLHAQWPLTLEVAAWLLCHAMELPASAPTGLVIDAIDVPLERDLRFGRGEIATEGPEGSWDMVYPAHPTDALPAAVMGCPLVEYVEWEPARGTGSAEFENLTDRTGGRPLVVRAKGVAGPWALARRAVVSSEDAERIRGANAEWGMLDDWRVAFVLGRGAQLVGEEGEPAPREGPFVVRFTAPMEAATLNSESVRLTRQGGGEPVAASLSWDSVQRELSIEPKALLAPGESYDVVIGAGVKTADGGGLLMRSSEELPAGVARRWSFTTENLIRVVLGIVDAAAGTRVYVPGREEPYVAPLASSIEVRTPPGTLAVRFEHPDGRRETLRYEVAGDEVLLVTAEQRKVARLSVEGAPEFFVPGKAETIRVRALDAEGLPVSQHAPVELVVSAAGCEVSPASRVTVSDGEAVVTLLAERPGRVEVGFRASEPGVSVNPSSIATYCKHAATSATKWSPVERHRVPRAERGQRDVTVAPRLRRWVAAEHEVRVLDTKGGAFARIPAVPGLPSRREFWVDREGLVHFHAGAAGEMVDVCYEHRGGRAAAVVVGPGAPYGVTADVEQLLAGTLREIGYEVVPAQNLTGLWPGSALAEHVLVPADARLIMDVAGLDEIFVATVEAAGREGHEVQLAIWSREAGSAAGPWLSRTAEGPGVRLVSDRRGAASFDVRRASEDLQRLLLPWLTAMGMTPSATLVSE